MGKLRPGGVKGLVEGLLASLEPEGGFPNPYRLARLGYAAVTNKLRVKVSQHNESLFCIQHGLLGVQGVLQGNCPPGKSPGSQAASVLRYFHPRVTEAGKTAAHPFLPQFTGQHWPRGLPVREGGRSQGENQLWVSIKSCHSPS